MQKLLGLRQDLAQIEVLVIKVDRDFILLPNDRYRVLALISIYLKLLMSSLDWEF